MSSEHIIVERWPNPVGYANGRIGKGRVLHVAGQIGWNAQMQFETRDFIAQFTQAIDNVITVVHAAKGRATDIVDMTVYVTVMAEYRSRRREIGPAWKARFGTHYPTMALVGVTELFEPDALVEIQAVAYLAREED
jgi:enamine deaminase RidA (YjgF/YER057c/UK114 family)